MYNMKKILILTEEFRAMTNANGVCTKAIVDVLTRDNDVMVLSTIDSFEKNFPNKYDGVKVMYRNNAWWEFKDNPKDSRTKQQMVKIVRKARNLLMKPFYPICSISPTFRFYKKACKLHEEYGFDIVLCFFHPFEAFIVGGLLKKKYPELTVVQYMLDTFMNYIPDVRLLSKAFIHKRNLRLENWGYRHCDRIINLQVQRASYDKDPNYNKFKSKMVYADIPLFKKRVCSDSGVSIKNGTMIYAGSLVKKFRNPAYALNLLSLMPPKYRATFYCGGDCNEMVREYAKEYDNIVMGGYIQHDLLEEKMGEAGVLINFGNYKLNMIPSKIFEYFSYEKKIIHFYKDDADTCLPYLKKYPYALLIDERESVEYNLKKLLAFLSKEIEPAKNKDWQKAFYMNTPEYSAKLILGEDH